MKYQVIIRSELGTILDDILDIDTLPKIEGNVLISTNKGVLHIPESIHRTHIVQFIRVQDFEVSAKNRMVISLN